MLFDKSVLNGEMFSPQKELRNCFTNTLRRFCFSVHNNFHFYADIVFCLVFVLDIFVSD